MNREQLGKSIGLEEAEYHKCGLKLDYIEVQELSNFIDSKEQTIKELREEIEQYEDSMNESNRFSQLLMSEKRLLEKEIESLKCCGNCGKRNKTLFDAECVACTRGIQLVTNAEKQDNWIKR